MNRFLALLLVLVTALPLAAQQFRYVPERPVPGDVVSFTYTPSAALAKETSIEGRYVRYAGPATMRLS
ncbi:MAG TPA: TlpA family protein disulfide reductase, partial [Fibrella sp.]